DIRKESKTFLQYIGVELSEHNFKVLYVPVGFAHGFQTLTERADMTYRHSAYYQPDVEGGIRYDDPMVGIEWPLPLSYISQKDQSHDWLDQSFLGI
ncbi:MAG: dTDP-4-dehydrorhamnose 3,5-epimerase family protein, partial [Saprospiraceae bacterium]|nr:dTDP-4-dehydrorhamnose 3,5-epimerase family protein [Saprospiraceae bacterium]